MIALQQVWDQVKGYAQEAFWNNHKIIIGDAIGELQNIPTGSIDFIFTDHPFGTTQADWDQRLYLVALWPEYWRVLKPNGCVALFAQSPYSIILGASQLRYLRYEWIWEKTAATGHYNAKKSPLKAHENILIFYKNQPIYNPQKTEGHKPVNSYTKYVTTQNKSNIYGKATQEVQGGGNTDRYPRSVLKFKSDKQKSKLHANQKPLALCEYFVLTYTNEGMVVLDNCAGSGTIAEACAIHNRKSISIDNNPEMLPIITARLKKYL